MNSEGTGPVNSIAKLFQKQIHDNLNGKDRIQFEQVTKVHTVTPKLQKPGEQIPPDVAFVECLFPLAPKRIVHSAIDEVIIAPDDDPFVPKPYEPELQLFAAAIGEVQNNRNLKFTKLSTMQKLPTLPPRKPSFSPGQTKDNVLAGSIEKPTRDFCEPNGVRYPSHSIISTSKTPTRFSIGHQGNTNSYSAKKIPASQTSTSQTSNQTQKTKSPESQRLTSNRLRIVVRRPLKNIGPSITPQSTKTSAPSQIVIDENASHNRKSDQPNILKRQQKGVRLQNRPTPILESQMPKSNTPAEALIDLQNKGGVVISKIGLHQPDSVNQAIGIKKPLRIVVHRPLYTRNPLKMFVSSTTPQFTNSSASSQILINQNTPYNRNSDRPNILKSQHKEMHVSMDEFEDRLQKLPTRKIPASQQLFKSKQHIERSTPAIIAIAEDDDPEVEVSALVPMIEVPRPDTLNTPKPQSRVEPFQLISAADLLAEPATIVIDADDSKNVAMLRKDQFTNNEVITQPVEAEVAKESLNIIRLSEKPTYNEKLLNYNTSEIQNKIAKVISVDASTPILCEEAIVDSSSDPVKVAVSAIRLDVANQISAVLDKLLNPFCESVEGSSSEDKSKKKRTKFQCDHCLMIFDCLYMIKRHIFLSSADPSECLQKKVPTIDSPVSIGENPIIGSQVKEERSNSPFADLDVPRIVFLNGEGHAMVEIPQYNPSITFDFEKLGNSLEPDTEREKENQTNHTPAKEQTKRRRTEPLYPRARRLRAARIDQKNKDAGVLQVASYSQASKRKKSNAERAKQIPYRRHSTRQSASLMVELPNPSYRHSPTKPQTKQKS